MSLWLLHLLPILNYWYFFLLLRYIVSYLICFVYVFCCLYGLNGFSILVPGRYPFKNRHFYLLYFFMNFHFPISSLLPLLEKNTMIIVIAETIIMSNESIEIRYGNKWASTIIKFRYFPWIPSCSHSCSYYSMISARMVESTS